MLYHSTSVQDSISMIYNFTLEEEQGEGIQLLNESRDADIGNIKY